jgi:hypothetical protein
MCKSDGQIHRVHVPGYRMPKWQGKSKLQQIGEV